MSEELSFLGVDEGAPTFRLVTDDIPIGALAFGALEHDVEGHHRSTLPLEPFLFRFGHRLWTVNKVSIHRISETRRHFKRLGDLPVLHVHLVSFFCLRRMKEIAPLLRRTLHISRYGNDLDQAPAFATAPASTRPWAPALTTNLLLNKDH